MGYFVKSSEDREAHDAQLFDRVSFRDYLKYEGINIETCKFYYAHELEEKYKDEFAMWLALKRMGVTLWI